MRKCDNPSPKFGGNSCAGSDRQIMPCSLSDCPGKFSSKIRSCFILLQKEDSLIGESLFTFFCLFNICLSLSDDGNKIKYLKLKGNKNFSYL